MKIDEVFEAIEEWYEESADYSINGITTTPSGTAKGYDQSEKFLSTLGAQRSVGDGGDSYEGDVFFEYERGKFIATSFWM